VPLEYTHSPVTVEGQTAVVVGGTSGIGRAVALAFAEEGADVVAASRSADSVARTADELRARGADTVEVTCDVTDPDSVRALRDETLDALGDVDVLVNSPGAVAREGVLDVTEESWDAVFDVQLEGTRRTTQAFAPEMGEGSIVNVSSMSAVTAIPDLAAYSTAKGGVDAFTRVAAEELGPEIRVNAVRPGFIETAQTEDAYADGDPRYEVIQARTTQGRLGRPEEVAGAVVYLASPAASYTTGTVLTVDDGFGNATFDA
jgi:NAD(P)-dependent dehydrogenase (short-subunit alcohol dehydrogenase family)